MTIFKEGDCLPESESIKPRFIILASGSERRMACLQQLTALPGIVGITSVPVAEAHNTDDLTIVAQSKIDALPSEYNNGFGLPYSEVEVWKVAADTQTLVPIMHDGRSIQLSSKGKPESIWAARTNLQMVLAVAEQTDQYPQYGVESASVLNGQHPYLTKRTITTLKLNPDKLREVITHFGSYIETFKQFYSQPPYSTSGLSPIDLVHISGGISLPVLVMLGVVDSIDGVKLDNTADHERVFNQTREALYNVAVGIAPEILEKIHPDAAVKVLEWDWLNHTTAKILDERRKFI